MNRVSKSLFSAIVISTLVFGATPALAHDDELEVTPAQGSTVTKGISEVSVTFSEAIMETKDNEGIAVAITKPNGDVDTYELECVEVFDERLVVLGDLQQGGEHRVNWRSVGSDGHAVEGSFSFQVDASQSHEWTGARPHPMCKVKTTPASEVTATPGEAAKEGESDFASQALPGLLVGLAFVLIAAVASAVSISRKRGKQDSPKYD